jgi:nucleoside-diphosphate-sugar epimerase
MNKLSVFGGTGFVGGEFSKYTRSIVVPRSQEKSPTNEIVYFISTIHNYNVFDDPFLDINTNLIKLIRVLDANKEKFGSDFTFNFCSSWFVYGETPDDLAREDSPCYPKGFYSITKRTAEQLIVSYCETFGISYRIFRLPNVLGVGDKKVSAKKNALQFLIKEMLLDHPIKLYYGGQFYRDYMDVRDIVDAMNLFINIGPKNEIVNICGTSSSQVFEDVFTFCYSLAGSRSIVETVDEVSFHGKVQVKSIKMDWDKIYSLIGWMPQINIYTRTLPEIVDEYKHELHLSR